MKLNHFICPSCGHDFFCDAAYVQCDACGYTFYANQSKTCVLAIPIEMSKCYVNGVPLEEWVHGKIIPTSVDISI